MDEAAAIEVVTATVDEWRGIPGLGTEGCRDLAKKIVSDLLAAGFAAAVPVEMPTVWQWRTQATPLWMDCQGKRHADRMLEAYGGQVRYRYESEWSEPSETVERKQGGADAGS